MKKQTRVITFCAVLAALSVVILLLGSVIAVADLTAAAIASFAVVLVVCELGLVPAFALYAVTAVLSMILLPYKSPAFYYALFLGYFPIIKSIFEKKLPRLAAIAMKLASGVSVLIANVLIAAYIGGLTEYLGWYGVGFVALGAVVVVVYDIALTRLILLYEGSLRKRLNVDKFFRK